MFAYQAEKIRKYENKQTCITWFFCCVVGCFCCCGPADSANLESENTDTKNISTTLISIRPIGRVDAFILSPHSFQDVFNKDENLVLVDVRTSDEFQKARIPGSINIPLFTLKTKNFFKSKFLVLLNNGPGYRDLEQECIKLNNHGFQSVRILYGGLNYWRDLKGPLVGDYFEINKISDISPSEYFVDRSYDDWVVIDVSQYGDTTGRNLIPNLANIPYSSNDKKFIAELEKLINNRKPSSLNYVLIVNSDGKNYGKIKQILKNNSHFNNVFYLQGGLAAYSRYLHDQTAVSGPGKKTVEKCGSCP